VRIRQEIGKAVTGQSDTIDLMLTALFAGGHILLEGPPGTAKTMIARCFAQALGIQYGRIQFTPDLMPGDIVGSNIYNFQTGQFTLTRGPIFCDLLLADEINRTPPKTQAALLEAMQEHAVTFDGTTHQLGANFMVVATQNPIEQQGTYPLPEAQLDRFLFKIELDYCDAESEVAMLRLPHTGVTPDMLGEIRPLLGIVGLDKARQELDSTEVPEPVARYVVRLVRCTREISGVQLGASSRAAIHLLSASKANARLEGRDAVSIEDVRSVAPYVLRHRLICEAGTTPDDALQRTLTLVPGP
jgi:MoxR-like ATPase